MPISYELGFDFSRDRFFNLIGAEIRSVSDSSVSPAARLETSSTLLEDNAGAMLTYNHARQETALTIGGSGPTIYTEAQIGLRLADRLTYTQRSDGFLSIAQPGPNFGSLPQAMRYTFLINQEIGRALTPAGRTEFSTRRFVTGTATLPQDIPASGIAEFFTLLLSVDEGPNSDGSRPIARLANFRINRATTTVEATITATSDNAGAKLSTVTFNFTGQLNPLTGRLVGSITSPEGYAGRFSGRLYGPAGREFGIAFTTSRGNDQLIGCVFGVQR